MRTGKFVVLVLVLLGVIAGVLVWQLGTRQRTYLYPGRLPTRQLTQTRLLV